MTEPELGVVAISRAGHDKGKAFLIVGRADTEHVFLADGACRTLAHPKKKKLRHLHIEPKRDLQIAQRLAKGEKLLDADVRKALIGLDCQRNQK